MRRLVSPLVLVAALGAATSACDDAWKEVETERAELTCRFQAVCADSTAGLDCDAYVDQYVPRADPCTVYDDFYIDACLTQLRVLVEDVEDDAALCTTDVGEGAPACTQAYTEHGAGACVGTL